MSGRKRDAREQDLRCARGASGDGVVRTSRKSGETWGTQNSTKPASRESGETFRQAQGRRWGSRIRIPAKSQTPFEREVTTKRRGEIAELAFALAAARRGFGISRPYGESERYDVILDPQHVPGGGCGPARPRLVRVQVKATAHKLHGYHQVAVKRSIKGGGYEAYRLSEVDFIAAYVIPEDAWFIFPLPHVLGLTVLLLKPEEWKMWHPYDYYREAWHMLWEADGIEFG
jgi:PD-(D/E)XK endonuclease